MNLAAAFSALWQSPPPAAPAADPLAAELASQRARTELARAKLLEVQYSRAYEAVGGGDLNRERPVPRIEFGAEDAQLPAWDRLRAIARGRSLHRNYGQVQGWEWVWANNVVGTCPKIHFNTSDPAWNKQAARWFNRVWAGMCDGRTKPGLRARRHLGDLTRLELQTVLREGDVLCYFDAAGTVPGGDGQCFYWEGDQLVRLTDWDACKADIARLLGMPGEPQQCDGVILDAWGRPWAYCVHAGYGQTSVPRAQATILPVENTILLACPWRLSEVRGVSQLLPIYSDVEDARGFRSAVLQRAKIQANLALFVETEDAMAKSLARSDAGEPDPLNAGSPDAPAYRNYRNLEKWVRGAIAYGNPGDKIHALALAGDSPELAAITDDVIQRAGFAQGLARMHATGRADASYSAAMAEGSMDALTFAYWQKWVERYSLDWKARQAIQWAMQTGRLPANGEWADFMWTDWPEAPGINPDREASARATRLANGELDYSTLLGPDWQARFEAIAAQLDYARSLNIPLAMLKNMPGAAPIVPPDPNP